jgi:hypothetical protein
MGKRICIVGFSEINRNWANQQPKGVEIWGLNEVHNCTQSLMLTNELGQAHPERCKCYNPHRCTCEQHDHTFINRYDRWFQIHPREWKEVQRMQDFAEKGLTIHPKDRNTFGRNEAHMKFLKECDKPIMMRRRWSGIPSAVRYPFAAVERVLGIKRGVGHSKKWTYSTSTPAWMLALAVYEHMEGIAPLDEVRIAGIELSVGTEYFWQRPCMEYYLGVATGLGIKVMLPPQGSAMLAAPRYALDEPIPTAKDYKSDGVKLFQPTQEQVDEFGIDEAQVHEVPVAN